MVSKQLSDVWLQTIKMDLNQSEILSKNRMWAGAFFYLQQSYEKLLNTSLNPTEKLSRTLWKFSKTMNVRKY